MTGDIEARFFASLSLLMRLKLRMRRPEYELWGTCQDQVDECRAHARTAIGDADKQAWLTLAAKWQKLAKETAG